MWRIAGGIIADSQQDHSRYYSTMSIADVIAREVTSWPGVTAAPHRFGGMEFKIGRRELGHLHGSGLADLPFPIKVRVQLVADGRAEPHHVLPLSGWVSVRIRSEADVPRVVELFRLNYDRPWRSSDQPGG
jgi:hypothetical protein